MSEGPKTQDAKETQAAPAKTEYVKPEIGIWLVLAGCVGITILLLLDTLAPAFGWVGVNFQQAIVFLEFACTPIILGAALGLRRRKFRRYPFRMRVGLQFAIAAAALILAGFLILLGINLVNPASTAVAGPWSVMQFGTLVAVPATALLAVSIFLKD
ncbi:hypothetical protein BSR28_01475 [Boudabousia liubingyangii]|uniref:hypothetical protein n=1 Tax=Boudabousia liubingyangii TaxID=1921764 RepID=UPI00093A41C3|nr:hypothetical protein [Boudabousia liubingyangii]OKL48399.1 hypothetical protein BSR28_01475 [Boudabousia liubingyangii]